MYVFLCIGIILNWVYNILLFGNPTQVPVAPPQNTYLKVISSSEVKLEWYPPPIDKQNGVITSYHVRVLTVDGETLFVYHSETTTLTVTSLQEHTSYKFEVAARTKVGVGPFYKYETVTTSLGEST